MKARIKKTGELVNLAPYAKITLNTCDSYGSPIELSPEEVELVKETGDNGIDWEQRRYEVARTILPYCAETTRTILMSGHGIGTQYAGMSVPEAVSEQATQFADALIERLKSKKQ